MALGADITPRITTLGGTRSRRAERIIYFYNQSPCSINFSYLENLTYPPIRKPRVFIYSSQAIFSWALPLQNVGMSHFYLLSVTGPSLAKYQSQFVKVISHTAPTSSGTLIFPMICYQLPDVARRFGVFNVLAEAWALGVVTLCMVPC